MKLIKDDRAIELKNPVQIAAYKKAGWKEVEIKDKKDGQNK